MYNRILIGIFAFLSGFLVLLLYTWEMEDMLFYVVPVLLFAGTD
jgi:hypothetical protein